MNETLSISILGAHYTLRTMAVDLLLYADNTRQLHTAGSLIIFGAEQAKRAKIIADLAVLELCNAVMQMGQDYNHKALVQNFIWDYLTDCVRILVFFEGYMKAELIVQGFCVHNLNKEICPNLTTLANQQKKRPISLGEIEKAEPFIVVKQPESITHPGIKETTISVSILLLPKYRVYYQLTDDLVSDIKYFNDFRNRLHFNSGAEFHLSSDFINRIIRIDAFIDATIKRWIKPNE